MKHTVNNKPWKVYIIGDLPELISVKCKNKFNLVQDKLEKRGFDVVNPIDAFNESPNPLEASLLNLNKLSTCNAVLIMSNVSLQKKENCEIKLALDLNLIILHGAILATSLN